MPMWYCMEKERDELEKIIEERARQQIDSLVNTDRSRLTQQMVISRYEEISKLYKGINISNKR